MFDAKSSQHPARSADDGSFHALVEHLPEGVIVHRDGRVAYANAAAARLLGYDAPAALVGRGVVELVHPDDRPVAVARVRALYAGAESVPVARERILRRDGTCVPVEVTSVRVPFEGAPAAVVIGRDASEVERLRAQLAMADRMASMGRLAASVAHEINNPLTYVLLHLDAIERALRPALEGGPAPDLEALASLAQRARHAIDGADRVRRIVRELRSFSRTDDEPPGPVDLRRALDAAADLASHELKHRARLVRDYAALPAVLGVEGRLAQVFLNLLVNAAHAVPEGAADVHEVRVRARVEGGALVVEVSDTGVGIAPATLERVFDPFFTTKPVGEGSGLGLSIARELLEQSGGSIEARSVEGVGSTFTVRLALASSDALASPLQAARAAGLAARSSVPRRRSVPPGSAAPQRVLVIDDEPFILRALRRALGDEFDVTTAGSVLEARHQLSGTVDFAVVLCDVVMPGASGVELFEWLEARDPSLAQRVLLMSGGYPDSRARALSERLRDQWIDKPFSEDEVRRRVRAVAARR